MAQAAPTANLPDLPLEVLTVVCQQLGPHDLICVAETYQRLRHGDGGPSTLELPTKSPMVTALRKHAFPREDLIPSTRPIGCSESWIAYMARCVRQRSCREAPPIAVRWAHSRFLDAAGRLLACGQGVAVGHGDAETVFSTPTHVAALASLRVRSVASRSEHSLALGWDGLVYAWSNNTFGQLGIGGGLDEPSPVVVEQLDGVCGIAASEYTNLAVTRSGDVFSWGRTFEAYDLPEDKTRGKRRSRPTILKSTPGRTWCEKR
jgi:hypothetical protein